MLSVFSPVHMVDENLQDTSLLASKSERFVSKRATFRMFLALDFISSNDELTSSRRWVTLQHT